MPKPFYESLKPKRFADVFDSPVCSLGAYKRAAGEESAKAVMVLILSDLVDFFNVGNSMNASQVMNTAELVLDAYGYLKIDDFKLCFDQAKRGAYGPVYRMDGNVILSWIRQYANDRMNAADEASYAQHVSAAGDEKRAYSFQELLDKQIIKSK
jgi:hypothetical protein